MIDDAYVAHSTREQLALNKRGFASAFYGDIHTPHSHMNCEAAFVNQIPRLSPQLPLSLSTTTTARAVLGNYIFLHAQSYFLKCCFLPKQKDDEDDHNKIGVLEK